MGVSERRGPCGVDALHPGERWAVWRRLALPSERPARHWLSERVCRAGGAGDYILGVQTLRNALTSASFFASACFTTLSLLIGAAMRGLPTRLSALKYSTTALLLIVAALSYLQSVRYMNT